MLFEALRAIASPIRVKVIEALSSGGKRLSTLAQELGVSSEQLAYHVRQLREADLIAQVGDLYVLSPRGRKVLELILELESEFLFEDTEPLVVENTGALRPLKSYLTQLVAEFCPSKEPGARYRRVKLVAKTLEELSQYGPIVPIPLATLLLSAYAIREGCRPTPQKLTTVSSIVGLEGSFQAINLLDECKLQDFASLRLVNFFISPEYGVLSLYIPHSNQNLLKEIIVGNFLPREIAIGVIDSAAGDKGILEVLPAISRYVSISLVTTPSVFFEVYRDGSLELPLQRNLLFTLLLNQASDVKGDNAQFIIRALNKGVAFLFSYQDLIPSSQLLTINAREGVQVLLGASTVSVSQVVFRAKRLGKDPRELLEKIILKVSELFLRLKKTASASLATLAELLPENPVFRAQLSLVGVEDAFAAGSPAEREADTYVYRLVNWSEELFNFISERTSHIDNNLEFDITFYAPPDALHPEFFRSDNLNPLSLVKKAGSFEETLRFESLLSLRVGKALSVLNVKADSFSALQLEQVAELTEKSGVKLFTLTVTNLRHCKRCGSIFGKATPRCPRCQSVQADSLIREALLYVPESLSRRLSGFA